MMYLLIMLKMMRRDDFMEELRPTFVPNNNAASINYSEYFIMRMKEYLMRIPNKNKILFVLKILLLLNWDKTYGIVHNFLRKYYVLNIKKYIPKLSFYKTNIKTVGPLLSSKIPQIAHKYVKDKSLLIHYGGNIDSTEYYINKDGIEFDHDEVHYYCYRGSMSSSTSSNEYTDYILECSSNLSYEETSKRINKLLSEFKPENVYVYDGTALDLGTHNASKIDRTMESIFLQEDVEKEIKNFVLMYDKFKEEYNKLGILFKNTFLVYGKPGTGKTTLAKVIASELRRDIVLFNLKDIKNIKQLQGLIYKYKNAVIVFEELDCLIERIKKRNEQKEILKNNFKNNVDHSNNGKFNKKYVYPYDEQQMHMTLNQYDEDDLDLSDFLEILDGMRSTEDSIMFFTTNYINRIDPAFKRQGRVNYLIEMKLCNKYQLANIYKSILQKDISNELYDAFPEYRYSLSNIIETILKNIFDLKQKKLSDLKLLELIELNHINFISTLDSSLDMESNNNIDHVKDIENNSETTK
ncbi:ATPase family protein [Tupanvirus soda lake]|uniref:ATPase family protein n=2 Tax=Tupanvirus TaxID=2094720 RepID=A0A6N1NNI1_9VIRU|nr:ATPase family protein [Tupanvirus soda lake]QKU35500.1 ATPase family protein [Tupanvirus soda lake]